jgi:hypothetical protein
MKDALGHGSNGSGRIAKPIPGHPFHGKTDAELRYIQKDASEAARNMRGMDDKAEGKYLDQVNDASTVLRYRDMGGKSDAPADKLASGSKSDPVPTHDGAAGRSDLSASIARGHAMRSAGDGGYVPGFSGIENFRRR